MVQRIRIGNPDPGTIQAGQNCDPKKKKGKKIHVCRVLSGASMCFVMVQKGLLAVDKKKLS
jgi:hypothetical protein